MTNVYSTVTAPDALAITEIDDDLLFAFEVAVAGVLKGEITDLDCVTFFNDDEIPVIYVLSLLRDVRTPIPRIIRLLLDIDYINKLNPTYADAVRRLVEMLEGKSGE